jgi:uncharacterized protein (TIGR03032 family)
MSNADSMSPPDSPLRSVHTDTLTQILKTHGVSVALTTYQAGHVVLFREENGTTNTHFRGCQRPMGLAHHRGRLALGVARELVQFRNMPDAWKPPEEGEPPTSPDACFMPRSLHVTGDIDIHEMAWGLPPQTSSDAVPDTETDWNELWFINTRFSCLCRLDHEHSFLPHWRPPFVRGLSPQDRCHLNGLGMVEGRPKYVTALGATDAAAGWRENKARGGVLIDLDSEEIISSGLSMPHSPRWYDGKLWLLESGDGSIGTVDLQTGKYEAICHLDGFTRGMDFLGPFAFVGISQVRESAVFSGIPITNRVEKRISGMSVVDLRSGQEVAFARFEDKVQEVFAVTVLPHRFPEMILLQDDLVSTTYSLSEESLCDVDWVDPPAAASEKSDQSASVD